jgi:hypothetical protein
VPALPFPTPSFFDTVSAGQNPVKANWPPDHESLERRGYFNGFLPDGFRRLPLAWERFPPLGDIPFSHWAARSWYWALLGPCTASMCNCRPNGTFCLQMGQITGIAFAGQ